MHRHTTRLAALALMGVMLSLAVWCSTVVHAQQPAAPTPLVFDGVTVIDVQQGRRIPAQRVVIVGDRIRAVGSTRTMRVPAGARVVDARGQYLIPGLWDMHTHSQRHTDLSYPLFLANGVTGIRDAGSIIPLGTLLLWRREILAGTRVGPPRQILSGPALDEEHPCTRALYTTGGELHSCVGDTADARHVVDSLKAAGADMIKTYDLGRKMYFVVAAEARRVGIPFGGHTRGETVVEASDSGARIVDHINFVMEDYGQGIICAGPTATVEQCQPVAERFKRHGTWLVLTLYAGGVGGGGPSALSVIQRVGLPILAGTDVAAPGDIGNIGDIAEAGSSLHAALAMEVAGGLTPLEALQTATLNPAKMLHGTDSLGTVAPGKLADLVLLDADPLVNITNTTKIHAVVANGRYFDRAALDQLLADARAKAKVKQDR